jgi:hypothetical protein
VCDWELITSTLPITILAYARFDVTSVLNPDLSLNETAWEQNRPLLLTPYLSVSG